MLNKKHLKMTECNIPFGDHSIQRVIKPVPNDYIDVLGKHNCDNIYNKYAFGFIKHLVMIIKITNFNRNLIFIN
jgi:hypothetical protein